MDNQPGEGYQPSIDDYSGFKEPREHVYHRPDTYIGSIRPNPRIAEVYDFEHQLLLQTEITLPMGIERTFLEPLSNSGDNAYRTLEKGGEPGRIIIQMDNQYITIYNEGHPIPHSLHPDYQLPLPHVIFGVLHTGSNFKDTKDKERYVCGRNGLGIKLTNIFSRHFRVRCGNEVTHQLYTQEWSENMAVVSEPIIEPYEGPSFTEVSFLLDFARFGLEEYPAEAFNLYAAHALMMSVTNKVPVIFNETPFNLDLMSFGQLLSANPLNDTNSWVHYQSDPKVKLPTVELLLLDLPGESRVLSFANAIATPDGGIHVDAAFKAVSKPILDLINGKKSVSLPPKELKRHLSMVLIVRVPNAEFNTQSKLQLTNPNPRIKVKAEDLAPIAQWDLVERMKMALEMKIYRELSKTDGKKTSKLPSKGRKANLAGKAQSLNCCLFLVEGNSAAKYVEALREKMGKQGADFIGYMPLRGKILNVTNASLEKLAQNKEISLIKEASGIREGVDYTDPNNLKQLNYGWFFICTDADVDGRHIKGLILNLFKTLYPSLLATQRIVEWKTPVIYLKRGKSILSKFYSERDFNAWRATVDRMPGSIEYHKGLGGNKGCDVEEDVRDPHRVVCFPDDQHEQYLRMAFDGTLADMRKKWITDWKDIIPLEEEGVEPISKFVHNELIDYMTENIERGIPSMLDGLKKCQRQVLYGAYKLWAGSTKLFKTRVDPVQVGQFGNEVARVVMYHHGDILPLVTKNMANDFTGSNNLPYFDHEDEVGFGDRNKGNRDMAQARYLHVRPAWWLNYIYKLEDLPFLEYVEVEGKQAEPIEMLPILPMALVNGFQGVGSGWSTFGANHHPVQVAKALQQIIRGETPELFNPWYRGFKGSISLRKIKCRVKTFLRDVDEVDVDDGEEPEEFQGDEDTDEPKPEGAYSMITAGDFEYNQRKLIINELPIGVWNEDYLKWLNQLKEERQIKDYQDYSTRQNPMFIITGFDGGTHKSLRLIRRYGLSNMILLDRQKKPAHYRTTLHILYDFFYRRLPYYDQRRQRMLEDLYKRINFLDQKRRLIELVIAQPEDFHNQPEEHIQIILKSKDIGMEVYDKLWHKETNQRHVAELLKEYNDLVGDYETLEKRSSRDLWMTDIDEFIAEYEKRSARGEC